MLESVDRAGLELAAYEREGPNPSGGTINVLLHRLLVKEILPRVIRGGSLLGKPDGFAIQ